MAIRIRRPLFWCKLLVAIVIVSWPFVQTIRHNRVSEPFAAVGAWLYSGGDNMGIPITGPEGVHTIYFNDENFSDTELFQIKDELKRLPNLRILVLQRTQITDLGLGQLADLSPGQIVLHGTQVTADGVQEFRHKVPGCTVHWKSQEEWDSQN